MQNMQIKTIIYSSVHFPAFSSATFLIDNIYSTIITRVHELSPL